MGTRTVWVVTNQYIRLEAATSRLEDLTVFHAEALTKAATLGQGVGTKALTDSVAANDNGAGGAAANIPSSPGSVTSLKDGTSSVASAATLEPPVVKEFDDLIKTGLTQLLALSKNLDPLVEEQVTPLFKAFEAQRNLLKITLRAAKPDINSAAFAELFKPIQLHAETIINIRETNRASKYINHLATVAEGIPALGWVTVESPVEYITDFKDSAQFYANRILKEYKDVDKKHVDWARTFTKVLTDLQSYVGRNHPKGLQWNPKGEPLDLVLKQVEDIGINSSRSSSTDSATGGAPPPPPPPPPPPLPPASIFSGDDENSSAKSSSTGGGRNALIDELNKGEGITSSLRKVDKSEMTHKNPALRAAGADASIKKSPPPPKKPANLTSTPVAASAVAAAGAASATKVKRPPHKELIDTKWIIENFDNEHNIIIEGEMNQGVFIDKCNNCTIQIKGKVSAVTLNECTKTGVLVENLVSGVDVIKSTGFGIQVVGVLPTLTLDQSHEGQVFLSKESLGLEVYTSQTSAINIEIPKSVEEGDYVETPLPEQLVHRIGPDGNIVSEVVAHEG